jgi:hypothetical protein
MTTEVSALGMRSSSAPGSNGPLRSICRSTILDAAVRRAQYSCQPDLAAARSFVWLICHGM